MEIDKSKLEKNGTKNIPSFIWIFLFPILLHSDDRLRLIHADILENKPINGKSIQELRGDVLFKKGELELSCNKAIFEESTGIVTLKGNTKVTKIDMHLTCDSLLFLSKKDILKNFSNVHIWDNDYDLTADSVIYITNIDSGFANGNVTLIQQKQIIKADALFYHKKPKTDAVSYEALGNVIIEEGSRIAKCGYAFYNRDDGKTILKMDPQITDNGRNLSGNEITLLYESEQLKSINIPEKAHMQSPQFGWRQSVNDSLFQKDSVETINDLKGKTLNGFFVNGELDSLRIDGMATSIYHVFEDSIYKGINEASGDEMTLRFENDDLEEILISGGAKGKFNPDSSNKNTDSPIEYSSKKIQFYTSKELTHLEHDASINYQQMNLTAGYMKMNLKSNVLNALPNLPNDTTEIPIRPTVDEKGKEPMIGDEILYNLKSKKGRIIMGETKMQDGYYYGNEIRNSGEDVYYIQESIFTTCELKIPHFHFESDQMKMINDDKVVARPLIMYVGGIPIFGIPFAIFPHQHGNRHSGWIMPTYGESSNRGQFLDGLGFYWAPNEYWDSKILMSFADRQGLTLKNYNRYNKRYSYTGNLRLETLYYLTSQKDITQISDDNKTNFMLNWSHRHLLRHDQKLSINAKYFSNGEYNRNTGLDPTVRLKQQAVSNATYSKQWRKWKNSISINLSSTRDLMADQKIDSTSIFFQNPYKAGQKLNITNNTLPSISFRHGQSQLFPEKSTEKKWYNNISWNYSSNFNNKLKTDFESDTLWQTDSTYSFHWKMDGSDGLIKTESNPVATHSFGMSAPQKIFKYISMNPSISIKHVWENKTFDAQFDSSRNSLIKTEKQGFATRTTGSFRLSLGTQFYGLFPLNIGNLQGIRHVASPSIGYSFTPDFSEPLFGYSFGYFDSFQSNEGNEILHDRFKGTPAGSTPKRKAQSMSLSLNNVFQAKIGEDDDVKKIDLFSWRMSTSYNFVADSLKFANLRSSVRTKLGKKLNLDLSMTHDFYKIVENDGQFKRINQLNKVPRLINARISTGFRFSGDLLDDTEVESDGLEEDSTEIDDLEFSNFRGGTSFKTDPTGKLWSTSLNLGYSLNKSNPLLTKETFWINTNTDIQVTQKWKIKYSARFDILEKELVNHSFSIYRDLHCWDLSLNWTPSGFGRGVYLKINVKSPVLKDIKIEQKSGLYGRRSF